MADDEDYGLDAPLHLRVAGGAVGWAAHRDRGSL